MNIDAFKGQLRGGGARPNLFEVEGSFPNAAAGALASIGGAIGGAVGQAIGSTIANVLGSGGPSSKIRFLCKAASIPESTLGEVTVAYRGRDIKLPGDREFPTWSITILNDTDFAIRNAFEQWMNLINSHEGNIGTQGLQAIQQNWKVTQLGKGGERLKTYEFSGCWPSQISAIDLDYDSKNAIETFQVTLQYQYWKASTTT